MQADSFWYEQDKYTAFEAGFLWFDLEPTHDDRPVKVDSMMKRIRNELHGFRDSRHEDKYFSRGALQALAVRMGNKPLFLFPELRRQPADKPVQAEEKPLGTRERSTLIRIIAAMAKDGYGNDLSRPFELAAEIAAASEKAGCPVGKETIGKYLKEAAEILGKS